jgi:hypothetical protein
MQDDLPTTAVTYVGLPISSGGAHSLGRMSRRAAYERTSAFLTTCTEPITKPRYSFRVHQVPDLRLDPRFERDLTLRFRNHFDLLDGEVAAALDYLDAIDPQPTNAYGMAPVWLTVTSAFRVLDPTTGRPLPGQDAERYFGTLFQRDLPLGSSRLALSLHNQAALSVDLFIPDARDETLARVIPWLQQNLPFKMSQKHWKIWTPTKSRSFKARKLSVSRWLT